ncbi:MAG: hypothetical protein M1824_005107 [Vezdaea acicularis]|nr:MAG: hypothetical protein M1824_005107 [Vezdaea acicularis]
MSFYQPSTPPYDFYVPGHSRHASTSSMYSNFSSPDSPDTALTTPVKSPIRNHGPMLLPKIRSQDSNIEPPVKKHRKALSTSYNPPSYAVRPPVSRRTTSPELASPASLCSPISLHSAPVTLSNFAKYAFPAFHQPAYTADPVYSGATFVPSSTPGASTFVPPPSNLAPREYILPTELQFFDDAVTTSTLMSYLTTPNPAPTLVRSVNAHIGRREGTHFWWDVRNLRAWDDFTLETISSIPGLLPLLNVAVPATALPTPQIPRSALQPESEAALHDLILTHYGTQLNAALKIAQGQTHMKMRSSGGIFISNYVNETRAAGVLGGGRVVGLAKSFDAWNSGMRAEAPHRKVEYLRGLAHLHKLMREHSCRYGFLMTEIELVVVRAGAEDVPRFGLLELKTIQLKNTDGLTAGLALWYLHMLAKEEPLLGQPGWKLAVGGPAARTRANVLEDGKDDWIPEPQLAEKRLAKRGRGWVFPSDPLHRRELPGRRVR